MGLEGGLQGAEGGLAGLEPDAGSSLSPIELCGLNTRGVADAPIDESASSTCSGMPDSMLLLGWTVWLSDFASFSSFAVCSSVILLAYQSF